MSDLCMYELQDNVWDEFSESDDHIVPGPPDESGVHCTVHTDSLKKLKTVGSGISGNAGHSTNFVVLGKREDSSLTFTKRDKMLEKGTWSTDPNAEFHAASAGESIKETGSMACGDPSMSNNCFKTEPSSELCEVDGVLGEKSTAVGDNLYDYPLSHISQAENSLNFFDNEDKGGNDLYYEWPDIGSFEDVDRMFRNCESAFGLGSLSNDDDLSWFSPSRTIDGSEDALRSGFKFSCPESNEVGKVSGNHGDPGLDSGDLSDNNSKARNATISDNLTSQITFADEAAALDHLKFMNGLDTKSESKDDSMPKKEMNLHRNLSKLQSHLEVERNGIYLENGDPFQQYSLEQTMETKIPLSSQTHQSYVTDGYHQPADQISDYPSLSSIKCERNGQPSPSLKESSYASNQVQSPHGSSIDAPAFRNAGKVNRHIHQNSQASNFNHLDGTSSSAISDPVAALNLVQQNENDDGHSEVGGIGTAMMKGINPSLVQNSSYESAMLDEISLEATSFRQLQQVMEQLDIRTKLCIRDSLYRLARSAEQRHHYGNPNSGQRTDGATNGSAIVEESNKSNGFMDMETDTNPIDRSVAHLLFHRPSDPSLGTGGADGLSPKNHPMIRRSVTSVPSTVIEENRVEETAANPVKMAAGLIDNEERATEKLM